jgi:hypothetical protein
MSSSSKEEDHNQSSSTPVVAFVALNTKGGADMMLVQGFAKEVLCLLFG